MPGKAPARARTIDTIETTDGLELRLHEWPAPDAAVTLALCHGYAEHAGRYAHVAAALNRRGITVVAGDLRGHGRSPGRRGHVRRFSDYLVDLDAIVGAARRRARRGVALLGHSLGGLITCSWLISRGGAEIDAAVLISPFLGLDSVSPLASWAAKLAPWLRVDATFSGSDLTRDPEMVRAHDADPLTSKKVVLGTIDKALRAARTVNRQAARILHPTLLLYAGEDHIISADSTDRFARALRMKDRSCERLPGAFHELLNELPEVREPLLERIGTWLLDHRQLDG